jgi:peptidoglycan/xylan/chitin deacetylase (PgdA/CDA1 family)
MLTSLALGLVLLAPKTAPQPGDAIAPFTVRTVAGAPYHWKPGKLTVVSFCAFWCDTWKQQLPRVEESKRSLQTLPIEFLNISVDGRWMDKAKGAPGLVLSDGGGKWSSSLGIDRVPYTLVLDSSGVVRWAKFGIVRSQDLIREARAAAEPSKQGAVYLTFDDFPWPKGNNELLDLLRAEGVPATFFCIGRNLEARSAVVARAAREGHSLQIHSWNHSADKPDLDRCKAALLKLTGKSPTLYRPPGGESILRPGGSKLALPYSNPYDYLNVPADEVVRRVALTVKPGGAVQMHGGLPTTLAAVRGIIANLRKRGYRFEALR